jgi:hypothetical protein
MKITKKDPLLSLVNDFLIDSPLPNNISYFWSFGSLLGFNLVILIISGLSLAMHYTPNILLAFTSIEHIMRDVNYGWLLRYLHANGASFFFIWVYLHIGRGLYYGSYRNPRSFLWNVGVVIYIVMMAQVGPNWNEININLLEGPVLAIGRIGPHNKIVLDHIICSLLGNGRLEKITTKKRYSYNYYMIQKYKNNGLLIRLLGHIYYKHGYSNSPFPKKVFSNSL